MFVNLRKTVSTIGALMSSVVILGVAVGATANDAETAPAWKSKEGIIPVTVTLKNITETDGPLYVSIQTREDYRSMKGHGGMIKSVTLGDMTTTFKVDAPGEYSVSVWHDLDDDGRFSMTEDYQVLDGWGASGNPPASGDPTFDDVKITVETFGATIPVEMKYPS